MKTGIQTVLATPGQQKLQPQSQEQQQQLQQQQQQQQLQQQQQQQQMDPLTQSTAETWLSIASLAETLGDADRAAMAYDATLQYNQSSTKALTSLAHLYRSRDMFQRAAELYERALAVNPELSDVWATLGHCYLMLDDLQRAYNAYQQALYHLSNPNVPKLWHGIGILYDRYGSLDYAEEAFAKVLELDPHFEKANEIYFRLGIIYKHQGKWNQALECFRYILPQPPAPLQEWDIWFQLGSVLENMGEWQGAREAYEHVLLQNEHHAKVLQQLGCLYGMNNVQFYDPQKALNFLLKSLEVDTSDATTWYHLGRVHMITSDYTAAYDAFQQAVNRDSRNPIFWCSIGVLYYQISQYRDALDAYTRAIRLNPYISEVWYDLGTLYETCNNQLTDALDAYKQAARLDPENVHIRERLAALNQQLANPNSNVINKGTAAGPDGNVTAPPPIMLQPTLQSNDQGNPLNIRPPATTMYANGPLGQQQAPQQIPAHLINPSHPQPYGAVAIAQQPPPTMLPPQQQQGHLQMKPLGNVGQENPNFPPQAMPHQTMVQSNQGSTISNAITPNPMGPILPQKRHMDGSIHTLVNAAVSSVDESPNTSTATTQVPTLLASQKSPSHTNEPLQKKLKSKMSPKVAAANLKIKSTTVKDKEYEKGRATAKPQKTKSIESTNGVAPKAVDPALPEIAKTGTADSTATITAPASATASVALDTEVPTLANAPPKVRSEPNSSASEMHPKPPVANSEPLGTSAAPKLPDINEEPQKDKLSAPDSVAEVQAAAVEAVAEAKEASAVEATAEAEETLASPASRALEAPTKQNSETASAAVVDHAKEISSPLNAVVPVSESDTQLTASAPVIATERGVEAKKVEESPQDSNNIDRIADEAEAHRRLESSNSPVVNLDKKEDTVAKQTAEFASKGKSLSPSNNTVEAAIADIEASGDLETSNHEPETVIKPSAEAIEKLQEDTRLREEEERERLQEEKSSTNGQFENPAVGRESVVRQVEEDENYDE